MKKALLASALMLLLAGCINEWVNVTEMRSVTSGGNYRVGTFNTKTACLDALQKRVQVTFTDVEAYTASDEEEHGLGLVLVCVEARVLRRKE